MLDDMSSTHSVSMGCPCGGAVIVSKVLDDMSSTHSGMGCPCGGAVIVSMLDDMSSTHSQYGMRGGAVIVSKMLVFLARCFGAGSSRRMMSSRVPRFQSRDSPFSVSMVLVDSRYLGYRKVEWSMTGVSLGACMPSDWNACLPPSMVLELKALASSFDAEIRYIVARVEEATNKESERG